MPKIKDSLKIDPARVGPPIDRTGPAMPYMPPSGPTNPLPIGTATRSPFMSSPLPIVASTYDSFARQFYSGGVVPQQRIFPVK